MIGYAPGGEYLSISPEDKDWHVRLARVDRSPCDMFASHHGKIITVSEVRQFLPDWPSLKWRPARKGVGPWQEITADDGEFRVALITTEGCTLADGQVIAEFRQFMSIGEV